MVQRFRTTSGSEYQIDSRTMTWKRLITTEWSGRVRKDSGRLIRYPKITVGQPAFLPDTSIAPGAVGHAVMTTEVVKLWEVEDDAGRTPPTTH
jgi:hypothetical protein